MIHFLVLKEHSPRQGSNKDKWTGSGEWRMSFLPRQVECHSMKEFLKKAVDTTFYILSANLQQNEQKPTVARITNGLLVKIRSQIFR